MCVGKCVCIMNMTVCVEKEVNHGTFQKESDMKRHSGSNTNERMKLVSQQREAIQCSVCRRWIRSRGGLSVHVCRQEDHTYLLLKSSPSRGCITGKGLKIYRTGQYMKGSVQCPVCSSWFTSAGGLSVHRGRLDGGGEAGT